jgi:hypothetical protein
LVSSFEKCIKENCKEYQKRVKEIENHYNDYCELFNQQSDNKEEDSSDSESEEDFSDSESEEDSSDSSSEEDSSESER